MVACEPSPVAYEPCRGQAGQFSEISLNTTRSAEQLAGPGQASARSSISIGREHGQFSFEYTKGEHTTNGAAQLQREDSDRATRLTHRNTSANDQELDDESTPLTVLGRSCAPRKETNDRGSKMRKHCSQRRESPVWRCAICMARG